MKLERGGSLPPGIAKRYLSSDLDRLLPPVAHGYERAEIDGQVVLIDVVSGVITDIIDIMGDNGADNDRLMNDRGRLTADAIKEASDKKWWQFWKD